MPVEHRSRLIFSTLASAYNGLVANPLFTGVLATELMKDSEARARNLPANLIGGAIGFLIFTAIGSTGIVNYLDLAPAGPITLAGRRPGRRLRAHGPVPRRRRWPVLSHCRHGFFGRWRDRVVTRALIAGLIFSVMGVVSPILLFSGETQIHTVVADPDAYGLRRCCS